jgi:3-dehydroquinate dehydratase-1
VRHRPTLIAPITDRTPLAAIRRAKAAGLRLVEARVDLFARRDVDRAGAVVARAAKLLPVLVTIRSSAEGGTWRGDDAGRLELYRALMPLASAVDVELDARIRPHVVRSAREQGLTVVLSHHDFRATPSAAKLDRVVARGMKAGADVTKIAAHVPDDDACARLAALFARHPEASLVVIGMGEHGRKTRVLFPALGSLFTFTALGRATAPGQLGLTETVAELRRYYPDFPEA